MATLSKVVNGEILHETFEYGVTPIWTITTDLPERVVENQVYGGITLLHGDSRVSVHTDAPVGDFVFQAKIEHEPLSLADIGGLFIQADVDSRIECQTYYNGLLGTDQYYEYIKVIRVGDRYSIYASMDGDSWDPMGASLLSDSHQVGVFLEGPQGSTSKNFYLKEIVMYKSTAFAMTDVPIGVQVLIKDSTGETLFDYDTTGLDSSESKVLFDVSKKALPIQNATIQVIEDGTIIAQIVDVDIHGGDVFDFASNIMVLIDDVQIDQSSEHYIGNLGVGGHDMIVTIINKEEYTMTGKQLSIAQYSDYFRGSDFAQLALFDSELQYDYDLYTFTETVDIPNLLPDERVEVIVKIQRDSTSEAPFFVNKYKFRLILE